MTQSEYNTVHYWVRKHSIKENICLFCGDVGKTEWSNISGDYNRELSDWQELCRSCHLKFDYDNRQHWRDRVTKSSIDYLSFKAINPSQPAWRDKKLEALLTVV